MDPQVEAPEPENDLKTQLGSTSSTKFLQAAALLTIWSLLVINEGSVRLNNLDLRENFWATGRPPMAVLFFASLGEVIFGLIGLFIGVSGMVMRYYSTAVVQGAMVVQAVLGWFVFIVYVFLAPIYRSIDLEMGQLTLSIPETRVVITMGIFTSFHFCLALQGGQFVFFARMISAATGQDFMMQNSGVQMRAIFWNMNIALAGLWTLITGSIVAANTEGGRLDPPPYFSPPNVGVVPGLTIFVGLLMIIFGVIGVLHAISKQPVKPRYYAVAGVVYLMAFLNYGIVQFGLFKNPDATSATSGAVAMHNGLVFMVIFLGIYFVHLRGEDVEEEE